MEIKIISVGDCYDSEFGNSIVEYEVPELKWKSYVFSDEYANNPAYPFNEETVKKEIEERLKFVKPSELPSFYNISDELQSELSYSFGEMGFIEDDDDCWTDEKIESDISNLIEKYPLLNNVFEITYGSRDYKVALFGEASFYFNYWRE